MLREPSSDLTERKEKVLRAIIVEYVTGAEPISSELLTAKYDLGGKSATIRAEMAEITELGYLEQPHTSAGRIPSDQGYRYYVDRLMRLSPASIQDKSQLKVVQGEEETLRELLTETTKALSRLTSLFTVAATIKDHSVQVRHVVVSGLGPNKVLLVLVLSNGHVENRILDGGMTTTLEAIGQANEALSSAAAGQPLGTLTRFRAPLTGNPGVDQLLAEASAAIRNSARDLTKGQFISDGAEYILAQPEFQKNKDLMDVLVRSLEDVEGLRSAIIGPAHLEDSVTIGKENEKPDLHPLAISRRIFYVGTREAGAIAIIGPTRQNYDRGQSLLDYTAEAVSQTLTKLFS